MGLRVWPVSQCVAMADRISAFFEEKTARRGLALALFLALNLDEKLTEGAGGQPLAKRQEELKSMQAQILSLKQQVADWERQPGLDVTTVRRMIGQSAGCTWLPSAMSST